MEKRRKEPLHQKSDAAECVVFLAGGFGNNMFQIALGEYLKSLGLKVTYHDALVRKGLFTFLLGWSIHDDMMRTELLKQERVVTSWSLGALSFLLALQVRRVFGRVDLQEFSANWLRRGKSKVFLFGYWQRGPHLNSEVMNTLRERVRKMAPIDTRRGLFVSHSRRGDFLPNARLSDSYYLKALAGRRDERVCHLVSDGKEDSAGWEAISGKRIVRSDGGGVVEDFFTMHFAESIICSNSTFCYWAVVLGDAENIVVPGRLKVGRNWDLVFPGKKIDQVECEFELEVNRGTS